MHPFPTAGRSIAELTGVFRVRPEGTFPMTSFKFLAGAAAVTALAAPAAAQYYPQQGYPQQYPQYPQQYPEYPQQQAYPGYGTNQGYSGNPVTDIIDQLLGNRYSVSDRQ